MAQCEKTAEQVLADLKSEIAHLYELSNSQNEQPLKNLDLTELNKIKVNPDLLAYINNYFDSLLQYYDEIDGDYVPPYVSVQFFEDGTVSNSAEDVNLNGSILNEFEIVELLTRRSDRVTRRRYGGGDFVIKREEDLLDNEKCLFKKRIIHEFFIGNILNRLWDEAPYFSFTFGLFAYLHPCEGDQKFLIRKYEPGVSLLDMLRNRELNIHEAWQFILLVIEIAQFIYDKYRIRHQNLHGHNVLLQELDGRYWIFEVNEKRFYSRYRPILIDFSDAQISLDQHTTFNKRVLSEWPDIIQLMWGFCLKTRNHHFFAEHYPSITPKTTHKEIGNMVSDLVGQKIFGTLNRHFGNFRLPNQSRIGGRFVNYVDSHVNGGDISAR